MTLTELRYVVAVARERHFGRAAEACFVSQPTLSVAIRKLEDELGVALFERGPSEITVTPIGQRIIEQAQRVLEEAEALKQLAQAGRHPLKQTLKLGAILTIGPYLLPHLVPVLHRLAPALPLRIDESLTATLTERLRNGDLDVIIISYPFAEAGIVTLPLYDETFYLVFPSGHALENHEQIYPTEIANENTLLLGEGHCFRDQIFSFCPELDRNRSPITPTSKTIEGGSLETIRYMVASGTGITIFPCTALFGSNRDNSLIGIRPFHSPAPTRRVALAWRRNFPRMEAIEILKQAIRDCGLPCVTFLDEPALYN